MVGLQTNAPAAFSPGEIPGTHFQRLSRHHGTWFCRGYHGKKSLMTPPGIDPGTCLNHYATLGPAHEALGYCHIPTQSVSNKGLCDEIRQNKVRELAIPTGCKLTRK